MKGDWHLWSLAKGRSAGRLRLQSWELMPLEWNSPSLINPCGTIDPSLPNHVLLGSFRLSFLLSLSFSFPLYFFSLPSSLSFSCPEKRMTNFQLPFHSWPQSENYAYFWKTIFFYFNSNFNSLSFKNCFNNSTNWNWVSLGEGEGWCEL